MAVNPGKDSSYSVEVNELVKSFGSFVAVDHISFQSAGQAGHPQIIRLVIVSK